MFVFLSWQLTILTSLINSIPHPTDSCLVGLTMKWCETMDLAGWLQGGHQAMPSLTTVTSTAHLTHQEARAANTPLNIVWQWDFANYDQAKGDPLLQFLGRGTENVARVWTVKSRGSSLWWHPVFICTGLLHEFAFFDISMDNPGLPH